jgi:YhcH/YjgK/YiaL family protein
MIKNDKAALEMMVESYPNIRYALVFLNSFSMENVGEGHIEIEGSRVYANVESYMTRVYDNTRYESHKKYIDIQYMIHGVEEIEVADRNDLMIAEPYDSERDVEFYEPKSAVRCQIADGGFFVFFPEDAHRPCIALDDVPSKVQKMVIKVAV